MIVVSIAFITVSVLQAGEEEPSPNIHEVIQRLVFLKGALFAKEVMSALEDNIRNELCDIRVVTVLVEKLPQEARRYGLTEQALQTDTELRLRQHGIKVAKQLEEEKVTVEQVKQLVERIQDLFQAFETKDYVSLRLQAEVPYEILPSLKGESDERFLNVMIEYVKRNFPPREIGQPTLYINVLPMVFESQEFAVVAIKVQLYTPFYLPRDSYSVFTQAVLWEQSGLITCNLHNLNKVRDIIVKDYIDKFINDYFAANPNQSPVLNNDESFVEKLKPIDTQITVNAISYNTDNPAALIGSVILHVGDTIYGVKIVNIHKDKVEFEKDGKTWTQKIGE